LWIHGVIVLARPVANPFDFGITGRAIDVSVENTQKNADSQSGSGDEVIFRDKLDVGDRPVGWGEQEILFLGHSALGVSEDGCNQ
jgi:hypothetical protein